MALRNRPTQVLGGGKGAPYLDWKAEAVGTVPATVLASGTMGQNGATPLDVEFLDPNKYGDLNLPNFQQQYVWGAGASPSPSAGRLLVLLDPWGHPYHYREWASVRQSLKDSYLANPTETRTIVDKPAENRSGDAAISTPVKDTIHAPDAYDIWSDGVNGVNEFGAQGSDDVTSWSQ
jgi:hypothetical protein